MTFRLLHPDAGAAFQPIAMARVLYVYITQHFCLAAQLSCRALCYMPHRHEKEEHWEECRVEMDFLV